LNSAVIRAVQRALHKGICHPPSAVWHAYWRWAAPQGIEADALPGQRAHDPEQVWPDGWPAPVPVLALRRGSAPATGDGAAGPRAGHH
jgi:hypothetical protein